MTKPILRLLSIIAIGATIFLIPKKFQKDPLTSPDSEVNEEYEKHKEEQSGAGKQMDMLFQARAYPDPNNFNSKFLRGWQQALDFDNNHLSRPSRTNMGSWNPIGPDMTIGGRILSIAIDPNNANNVFAGSASGGIWKSINAGGSWSAVATGLPVLGVPAIAFLPGSSSVILAGTGEVYRTDTSNIGHNVWKARGTYGTGIVRSADGGVNWTTVMLKDEPDMFGVLRIKFNPLRANTVYACTTDGLFRSFDGGVTWGATPFLNKTYVSDVAINPADTTIVVAAVGNLVNSDKGIYRTTNSGGIWNEVVSVLPVNFGGFIRLANSGSGTLYASYGRDDVGENELFVSTNFGSTWTSKANSHHTEYQFWFANAIAINPSNVDEVIMGGVDLYRYNSASSTSSVIGTAAPAVHSDIHDIVYQPGSSSVFYVACDGGIYKTINNGSTFTRNNTGLSATQFYASIAVSPTDPNVIVGGLQDNGVVRFDGSAWSSVLGGDGGPCVFHPNGQTAFASNDARRINRSTNYGASFAQVLASWAFVADDRTGFMAPIAISKSDPTYVYAASDNLHKSTSTGASASWSNSATSSVNYIEARYKTAVALAVSPTNRDKIYVSTSPFSQRTDNTLNITGQPNVLRSTNGGTSFTSIKSNLPNQFVMDFAISATNDDSVFVVLGGFGPSHVFVRDMTVGTWTDITNGLPDVPFNAVFIDPLNPQVIYVGSDVGVYVSPNRGGIWYNFSGGLWDITQVFDIQATQDNQLILATHGKGVFRGPRYSGLLPVNFLSFTGKQEGIKNNLSWKVSEEVNLSHYEIERSEEGIRYTNIDRVNSRNSRSETIYSFNDLVNNSTSYYYRLKSVNQDGTYTYSSVVFIRRNAKDEIQVMMNPFVSSVDLKFTLTKDQKVQLFLYDLNGKLMKKEQVQVNAGVMNYTMSNTRTLARGTYIIEAILDNRKWNQKILKQ